MFHPFADSSVPVHAEVAFSFVFPAKCRGALKERLTTDVPESSDSMG